MTDFIAETRHYCRNPRCRSKLPAPVANPREAYCVRGCFNSFYLHRCIVCERAIEQPKRGVCARARDHRKEKIYDLKDPSKRLRKPLEEVAEFTPDEEAFRAAVIKRFGDALRPCLDEAIGKDIREHEAWSIVSAELIKLASLYAIQIGSTADEIAALARDCYNQALQLSREQAGGLN
jgi:hypothetical protein